MPIALSEKDRQEKVYTKWRSNIELAKDKRPLWEAQVSVCENFAEGNHRVAFTPQGQFKEYPIQAGELWRTVNLWPTTLSVIVSRLTANAPRWNPRKSELEDVTDEEIEAANAALQNIWDGSGDINRSLKKKTKRGIPRAYKQGAILAYYRFDSDLDLPVMDTYQLWDVYADPSADALGDKQWLSIVLPKHIDWLKARYPLAKTLTIDDADNESAESGLKQQFLKKRTGSSKETTGTIKTIFGFRVENKEWEEEEMKEEDIGQDDNGVMQWKKVPTGEKIKMEKRVIVHEVVLDIGESPMILHREELDYQRLDEIFGIFTPSGDDEFYARPPCIDWVDPSKTINKMNSNAEQYIDLFLQGRWVKTKKKLKIPLGNRQGEGIYAQPGDLTQLPLQPLPQTHFTQLQNALNFFQRVSSVNDVSTGSAPAGIESGKAINTLIAADAQNSSPALDEFKMFMQESAVKLLRLMADNWSEVHSIYKYDQDTGDMSEEIRVIGEDFTAPEGEEKPTVKLRRFKRVDVEIIVEQFFTSAARQRMIIDLFAAGWTPGMNPIVDKVILDSFDIGIGREIVKELKKLRNPDLMIVEANVMKLLDGQRVVVHPDDPHQFFKNFYTKKGESFLEAGDEEGARLMNGQAQKHDVFLKRGAPGVGNPEAPEGMDDVLGGEEAALPSGAAAPDVALEEPAPVA